MARDSAVAPVLGRRPRVLLSAYACEPDRGSEPGVGYHWAREVAAFADVWVLTRSNNRESLEADLSARPVDGLTVVYCDLPAVCRRAKALPGGLYLYYPLWQWRAYRAARRLHREKRFDIVHHITFGNLWQPTFMPRIPTRFVWGPLGGAEMVPAAFARSYRWTARLKESVRRWILATLRWQPLYRAACRRASGVLAKTTDTARVLERSTDCAVVVTPDVGVDTATEEGRRAGVTEPATVVAAGRLDAWRGSDLLLRAFDAAVRETGTPAQLRILGDGPERSALERLRRSLGAASQIQLVGHVSRERFHQELRGAVAFVSPTVREASVTACFVALSAGVPLVCLDVPGVGQTVDSSTAFVLAATTPEDVVEQLARALTRILTDADFRNQVGRAGQSLVREHHTWRKRGDVARRLYETVLTAAEQGR